MRPMPRGGHHSLTRRYVRRRVSVPWELVGQDLSKCRVHGLGTVDRVKGPAIFARHLPQALGRVISRDLQGLPYQEREHANARARIALPNQAEIIALVATI